MQNAYSSVKIFHHSEVLNNLTKGICSPIYIRIKPTNICNHHCFYCGYGSGYDGQVSHRDSINHQAQIPWEKMQEILNDIKDMGVKAITFSGGGEPLTYHHIYECASYLKDNGIDYSLISNGSLLCGKIAEAFYDAKWVRVSFDSPNEKEYLRVRGLSGDAYKHVIDNISNFANSKSKNCVLGINFVISKENYLRVFQAARFLKEIGVNNVKFSPVLNRDKGYHKLIRECVLDQLETAKAELLDESFQIYDNYSKEEDALFRTYDFSTCYICKLVTIIGADCKVYFCHGRAYNSDAIVGDISNQSFKKMWLSDITRKKLDLLVPQKDCKGFCVYEDRNRLIQSYYDVDLNHVNFI